MKYRIIRKSIFSYEIQKFTDEGYWKSFKSFTSLDESNKYLDDIFHGWRDGNGNIFNMQIIREIEV